MPVHLITPPGSEPVTLEEVHAHCEIDLALRDGELGDILTAARQLTEKFLRRALVTQTWELVLERFANEDPSSKPPVPVWSPDLTPPWAFGFYYLSEAWPLACRRPWVELPFGSLSSVASVTYVDGAGVLQTLVQGTDYTVDAVHLPGRIYPAFGKSWPMPRCQWDAVKIQYVVGTAAGNIDKPIKQAILMLCDKLYEHDRDEGFMRSKEFSVPFEALLTPYKIFRL